MHFDINIAFDKDTKETTSFGCFMFPKSISYFVKQTALFTAKSSQKFINKQTIKRLG